MLLPRALDDNVASVLWVCPNLEPLFRADVALASEAKDRRRVVVADLLLFCVEADALAYVGVAAATPNIAAHPPIQLVMI